LADGRQIASDLLGWVVLQQVIPLRRTTKYNTISYGLGLGKQPVDLLKAGEASSNEQLKRSTKRLPNIFWTSKRAPVVIGYFGELNDVRL
jgi:hypothetical protein